MSSTAKFRWYFAAAALACVSLAGPAPAPQGSGAITSQIDLDEPVTSVLFGDVDGDGLKDMVLLLERRLAIHKLRADHTYPPKPDYVVKLPADAVAVDLPNFDPKNKKATLLAATARGLFTRDLSKPDAPFESLGIPELPGALFPRASGALPVALALTADFDGDGSLELLVPLASGLGVLRRFADGWRWIGTADAPVAAERGIGEDRPGAVLQQTFELPRVATLDAILPGGKRVKYLTVTRDLDSWVYRVDAESLVAIEHARGLFRFDSEDKFRAVRGTRRNEETNDRSVGLVPADLNGDGIPDFVSSRFRDGQVFLTIGRPGSFTADAPDRVIDADGWVVLAQARDFDGDGRPDLLVPRLPNGNRGGAQGPPLAQDQPRSVGFPQHRRRADRWGNPRLEDHFRRGGGPRRRRGEVHSLGAPHGGLPRRERRRPRRLRDRQGRQGIGGVRGEPREDPRAESRSASCRSPTWRSGPRTTSGPATSTATAARICW